MIGKIISDSSGLTALLDGRKNKKINIQTEVDVIAFKNLRKEIATLDGDEILIRTAVEESSLKDINGLADYAVQRAKEGKMIQKKGVTELLYTNIANQAHGFAGVNAAIEKYNELTDEASKNKFAETISKSNSSLGKYLSGLTDANGGILKYGISLFGATVKTFALELATTAMNAAISMGTSLIVSGIVSAITSWINHAEIMAQKAEEAREKIQSLNQNFKENQTFVSDNAKRYAELAQGVEQLTGKNISLNSSDYQEFLDLNNQLAEMFPNLSRTYDENGNAIVQLSGSVDTIVGSLHNLIDAQRELTNKQIAEELPTIFKDVSAKSKTYTDERSALENKRDALTKNLNSIQNEDFSIELNQQLDDRLIFVESDNPEVLEDLYDSYVEILESAGLKLDKTSEWNKEYKNGKMEVPVSFSIPILSADTDVANAKKKIQTQIEDLAENYEKTIEGLNGEINRINADNKANWSSFTNSMFAWLATDDTFKAMDDTMQSTMQNIINNLNWSEMDFNSFDDATAYVRKHILSFFQNGDNKKLYTKFQVALDAKTQFNNGEITFEEYKKKIENFLPLLDDVPEKTKKAILFSLGLQMDNEKNKSYDADTLLNNVKEKLQDEFDDKAGELTLNELKIASEIEVQEGEQLSWEELLEKIKEVQETLNEPLSLDDFKTASETLSSISNAFKEMSDNSCLSLGTLSSIKTAVGSSIPDWDAFQQKLMNAEAGSAGFNQAMGQLTYAVLENQLGLKGLAGADEQYIAAILRENGLLNASAIAHEMVRTAQARQKIQAELTKDATEGNVAALINNAASCGIAQNDIVNIPLHFFFTKSLSCLLQ